MDYDSTISWFQTKIGTYDKANWERVVEKHEISLLPDLQKIQHLRSVQVRTDLIDVDLVRGSTFSKAKPAYHWTQVTRKGILRVLLFPIYWRWWQQQTSFICWLFFFVLYFSQLIGLGFYFSDQKGEMKDIPFAEAISPVIIMVLLGEIYIHVVSTNFTKPSNRLVKKKRKARKNANGRKKRKESKEERDAFEEKDSPRNLATDRDHKLDEEKQEEKTAPVTEEGGEAEERHEKHPYGRDSSTGDTSSGSDTSTDSSTSSISDAENGVNDLDDENPFETPSNEKLQEKPKSNLNIGRSPVEETGEMVLTSVNALFFVQHWPLMLTSFKMKWQSHLDRNPILKGSNRYKLLIDERLLFDSQEEPHHLFLTGFFSCVGCIIVLKIPLTNILKHVRIILFKPFLLVLTVMVSVWDGNTFKKVKMTLLEISSAIVKKVDSHHIKSDYFPVGILSALFLALLPMFYRIKQKGLPVVPESMDDTTSATHQLIAIVLGTSLKPQLVVLISMLSRFSLSFSFFFLLCVAERAYRMRYLYAKYFGALTSARKARRNCLPHFRLHKVRHIKTWLSLRSFLKKRGPQRSVDTIMSSSFVVGLIFVVITCIQLIKYNGISDKDFFLSYYLNWEVTAWTMVIGIYLMRFLTLGAEINMKYRNNTVLLTEQINLYLQMEHAPHKKEELSIANNVLKLASKLLKELESPFKISGFIMSPLLSNIIRVVVLSLFSGVMSDVLGFRLKLWKIKAE